MALEELKKTIDYFVGLTGENAATYISLFAAAIAILSIIVSFYTFRKQRYQSTILNSVLAGPRC
jgi:hypothetical protein